MALLLATTVNAESVSRQQAQLQAAQFLGQRGVRLSMQTPHRAPRKGAAAADDTYYYVFNADNNQGFVVVSGDDRTVPVLGYVDHGSFDEQQLPEGLRWMLQSYTDQIQQLDGMTTAVPMEQAENKTRFYAPYARHNVAPLLPMNWNQGGPYNLLCPIYYNEDGTQGNHSATGCVATAMAQVVGYYRWPEKTKRAIPGYIQKYNTTQGEKSVRLNSIPTGSVIDWDNILDNYNGTENDAQKKAISELMYWVGMNCKMSYGASSASGYSEGIDGLVNVFDFDDGTHVAKRDLYTSQEWFDLIYNEIATGHPVPYGGQNSGGGHAFVLDGYDVAGLFHVNWGWGGMANGYFRIDVLDPDNSTGIGASPAPGGYNMGQDAIIGMKRPDDVKADEEDTPQYRYKLSVVNWELRGANRFFAQYINWSGTSATWNTGIGYVNNEGKLTLIGSYQTAQLSQNYLVGHEFTISGLSKGTYHVVPVSKRATDKAWRTDVCSDLHYILVEVGDNGQVSKMEIHPVGEQLQMTEMSFPGNHKKGENQTVCATFKNISEDECFKEIHLLASQTQDKGRAVCRTAIVAKKDGEATVSLTFKPEQTGTWNVWLATDGDGNNVLGESSFEVTDDGINVANLRYASHTVANKSGGMIYGNRMQGRITVMNQGKETFDGNLKLWLFKLADNGLFYGDQSTFVHLTIAPSKTASATYNFENLELNRNYVMSFIYETGGDIQDGGLKAMGTTQTGIVYWQANQSMTGMGVSANLNIPSGAVAVDMSGLGGRIQTVRPNSNPNTLYVFGQNDQVPGGLENCNVVVGNNAEQIVLTDSMNFFSPCTFTAKNISYTRNASANWETIALPFAVQQLPENVSLLTFQQENEQGTPAFALTDRMESNVPYLLKASAPGSYEFKASDVAVTSTTGSSIVTSTDTYQYVGTTLFATVKDALLLNNEGTAFLPMTTTTARVAPFRAYFVVGNGAERIDVDGAILNAVETVRGKQAANDVFFDLQGRRVLLPASGIYIQKGKKVVIR